jgi:excisionase family DNA binding protein
MSIMTDKDWITTAEAADLTRKPPVTVRRWAREGAVEAVRSGGVWLVDRVDLERFIEEGAPRRLLQVGKDTEGALTQAWNRVSRDLERDDLPDIIEHKDFEWNRAEEIQRLASEIADGYRPRTLRIVEMPKSEVLSRPLADLAVEDRIVYEACVQTLAIHIDGILDDGVFSSRLRARPTATRLTKHWPAQYSAFEAEIQAIPIRTGARSCLVSDVSSFYEYIDHDLLMTALEDIAPRELSGSIETLSRLLPAWREQHRVMGIPQGPQDASGILANGYLAQVDSTCAGAAIGYARWGDDLRIFFADHDAARRFAPRLVEAFRRLGLNLAAQKTSIESAPDLAMDSRATRRAAVDYGVESMKTESLAELRTMFDEATSDRHNVDVTDLRFSIWRLGLVEDPYPLSWLLQNLGAVTFAANLVADYLSRLGYIPEVGEAVTSYLRSPANVYPWVELHLVRLLGTFDWASADVLELLRSRITGGPGPAGDFAARTLGAVGTPGDRQELRRLAARDDLGSMRRRAAIIGAADTDPTDRAWLARFKSEAAPAEVRRAAAYAMGVRSMPRTLIRRRTPPWAPELRSALLREGLLAPRAA